MRAAPAKKQSTKPMTATPVFIPPLPSAVGGCALLSGAFASLVSFAMTYSFSKLQQSLRARDHARPCALRRREDSPRRHGDTENCILKDAERGLTTLSILRVSVPPW